MTKRGREQKYHGTPTERRKQAAATSRANQDVRNVTVNGETLELIKEANTRLSEKIGVNLTHKQTLTLILKEWLA